MSSEYEADLKRSDTKTVSQMSYFLNIYMPQDNITLYFPKYKVIL